MLRVNLVCALACEAAPIVSRHGLERTGERPFVTFEGEQTKLIVSGVGVAASAAAVGYLAAGEPQPERVGWINCGVAGHGELPLGTAVLADRVAAASGTPCWYPTPLLEPPCGTATVLSFDAPVTDYPPAACCDMEAAGFVAAAMRVAAGDLVQVLKIVSDNRRTGLGQVDRARITALVEAKLSTLDAVLDGLRALAARLPEPFDDALAASFARRWRFTHAQSARLRDLLRRHRVLGGRDEAVAEIVAPCPGAAEVIAALEDAVARLPLRAGAQVP